MTSEWKPKPTWNENSPRSIVRENVFCSAMPVTMPGSAMGSTIRNDTAFLPKNVEALHRERGERAEHQRDDRGHERDLARVAQRLARALGLPRLAPPLQA